MRPRTASFRTKLLDAAFAELSGTPGPTPQTRLAALRKRFPKARLERLRRALNKAYAMKWRACELETDRSAGDQAAARLAREFPGFSRKTYRRAVSDARTINLW